MSITSLVPHTSPLLNAVWVCLCLISLPALADICKYADADGRVTYSNVPLKDMKKLSCDFGVDSGTNGKSKAKTPTPAGFPKVDAPTQKGRDEMRRKILSEELAAEEKMLSDAQTQYRNGNPDPLPSEEPKKYQERLERLKKTVALHERNIQALRQELAAIR